MACVATLRRNSTRPAQRYQITVTITVFIISNPQILVPPKVLTISYHRQARLDHPRTLFIIKFTDATNEQEKKDDKKKVSTKLVQGKSRAKRREEREEDGEKRKKTECGKLEKHQKLKRKKKDGQLQLLG